MRRRSHAVVIGASMSGLLAARALADEFERVTVLERDELPEGIDQRPGVPQGRHVHALLARGRQVLDELFPGFSDELVDAGATTVRDLDQLHFEVLGHLLSQQPHDEPDPDLWSLQATRPLLEGTVRARLRRHGNVVFRDGFAVRSPLPSVDWSRVIGLEGTPADGGPTEVIPADLVVDASGRSGRAVGWLREWGYPTPDLDEMKVRVSYVSQLLHLEPDARLRKMYLVGPRPGRPEGMALFACENGTWVLTVVGMGERRCAADHASMLAATARLAPPELRDALPRAAELSDPVAFAYPVTRRLHYERMTRFPTGFAVTGDAICSFNPIYGQGMTVAAVEALALRDALRLEDRLVARAFFRAAARPVGTAWQLATGSDLGLPEVAEAVGHVPTSVRAANAWVNRVLRAAEHDQEVATAFLRVTSLVDAPTALFRPHTARHVLRPRRAMDDELVRPRQLSF